MFKKIDCWIWWKIWIIYKLLRKIQYWFFRKVWFSTKFIRIDKRLVNDSLKTLDYKAYKHPYDFWVNAYPLLDYLLERKKGKFPLDFFIDILKKHNAYFHFRKGDCGEYPDIRISYYGHKFIMKGGYCWGYYIKKIFPWNWISRKAKQYTEIMMF